MRWDRSYWHPPHRGEKELLEQIGISFEICAAKGEERITKSVPHEVVEELASQKAVEVASMVRTYEETHQELVTPSISW